MVAHGDIKPDNILVDPSTQSVVLSDYGCATNLKRGDVFLDSYTKKLRKWTSKHYWLNRVAHTMYSDTSVDMFSMMFVLLEVLIGHTRILKEVKLTKTVDIRACIKVTSSEWKQVLVHIRDVIEFDIKLELSVFRAACESVSFAQ